MAALVMWPPLLLAVALGLGHAHQLGAASLRPRLPVGPSSTHSSAFACALRSHPHVPRSTRMRPDGRVSARRGALATMCAQPAESHTQPAESPKLSPRLITSYLTSAESFSDILDVYKLHGSSFDEINVATSWNRLGKVRGPSRERTDFFRMEESTLLQLLQHTERVSPRLGARGIANACYGMARLGFEPARATMHLLGAEAMPRLDEFDAQGLANTAWAFSTLGITDHQLFEAIARESKQHIGSFTTQNLANTAWAFATRGVPVPQLFEAIARESEQRIGSFDARETAITAWAFATLGVPAPQLFGAIARESVQRIGIFKPRNLANTAWAFATLGEPAPQLFDAIARESERRIGKFKPQDLSNTAWAFTTLGVRAPQLFDAIARESEQRIARFTPQDLANTAWAFAIVGTAGRGALVEVLSARTAEMGLAAFSGDERCQLHQFFLSVEACLPAELLAPIGLRDACREAMAGAMPMAVSKPE
jgi:hypothetical protein